MSARDVIAIAQGMIDRYGSKPAADRMRQRIRQHRLQGDDEAATLWSQVAAAIRALQAASKKDAGSVPSR